MGVLAQKLKKLTHCGEFILFQIYYNLSIQSHPSLKSTIYGQLVGQTIERVV